MLNRVLMEAYDDYSEGNYQTLIDFADKTFTTEGVKKLFIACTIIMFTRVGGAKPRYYCDRERLESIVLAGKEKTGDMSYLQFFVERINREKGVSKYFNGLFEDPDFDKYVGLLLGYLNQFSSDFVREIRREVNKKVTDKEVDDKTSKAREFCSKVKELANECNLPFFVVTDGASAISNNGCEAVKNARDNHIKWELENGSDPNEDWSEEEK